MITLNRWLPFDEAVLDRTRLAIKLPRSAYLSAGRFPVIDQGQEEISGYTDDLSAGYSGALPVVLFGDHTRALKLVERPFAAGADGIKVLEPCSDLNAKFLWYYLRSRPLPNDGYSRHFKHLRELRVPIPAMGDQLHAVDLLSRAENIIRMRREAEKKAKEIIPALFLDMFGDPGTNPKGWPVKPLAVLVRNLDSARKPVRAADRAQMAGRYPYYGASGIIDHVNGYTHEENALLVAEDGANLLSRSTPIAFQASGRYWVNNHAHVLGHAGVAELTFLECSLNLRDLREYITGSAQPKLTQAALLSIPIAVAPVAAQASFARRLSSTDVVVSDQQKAIGCAEQVFQSLLTGVFSEGVAS